MIQANQLKLGQGGGQGFEQNSKKGQHGHGF